MRWLVAALGVAMFVLGGAADSPGLQGIAAALVAAAIIPGVRTECRGCRPIWNEP